uniref:Uncharacterized protein n=1 Tax=Staphylothermus marinus TaxID=2280 RepID=A0A7C4JKU6_STAMA
MIPISIQLVGISAERLSQAIPPRVDFSINLTLPSGEIMRKGNQVTIPFVFTVMSTPPIVQITLKGSVMVSASSESDAKKLEEDIVNKKMPLPIVQAVMAYALADTVYLSRSLGLPPPIPQLTPPQQVQDSKQGFKQNSII